MSISYSCGTEIGYLENLMPMQKVFFTCLKNGQITTFYDSIKLIEPIQGTSKIMPLERTAQILT
jgi:hypothetical protein